MEMRQHHSIKLVWYLTFAPYILQRDNIHFQLLYFSYIYNYSTFYIYHVLICVNVSQILQKSILKFEFFTINILYYK